MSKPSKVGSIYPHLYFENIPKKTCYCLHEAYGGVCVLMHLLEPSSWSLWATLDLPISLVCPIPSHSVSCLMLPSLEWGTLFSDEIFDLQPFFPLKDTADKDANILGASFHCCQNLLSELNGTQDKDSGNFTELHKLFLWSIFHSIFLSILKKLCFACR